jgi:hypothetical protein
MKMKVGRLRKCFAAFPDTNRLAELGGQQVSSH